MIVAVPVLGEEVAPWFCHARELLVVDLAPPRRLRERTIDVAEVGWPDRLSLLVGLGVTVLLVNGFTGAHLPVARARGLHVITGISGEIEPLLEALRNGHRGARHRKASSGTSRSSRGR
jgi:predicted Fe-Mo cluster-binding NifX family protein